jgi:hypothetical protein
MTTTPVPPRTPPPGPPAEAGPPRDYPVRLDARLDEPLSRWLWLVKWLLALPHYVVLAFLWMAFVVLSVVAFFAILFTGRYPRAIFDFNVGVLRWSWRVGYYAYGGLGTDRYPPFSLGEEPDYPARLSIDYPGPLSRGLVLVKWWLLALPHYLIVGLFVGGGSWVAWSSGSSRFGGSDWQWGGGGLVGILVCVAAVILLFTGRYPTSLFDIVVGMNRWAFRVFGYAALMTDRYPPFRLDLGGTDPGSPAPLAPSGPGGAPSARLTDTPPAAPATPHPAAHHTWTAGAVVTLVVGTLASFGAVGLLVGGLGLTVAGNVSRDSAGYLTSPVTTLSTDGYAITTDTVHLGAAGDQSLASRVFGTVRVRVDSASATFVGIGRTADVQRYLAGASYDRLVGWTGSQPTYVRHSGTGVPATAPGSAAIWAASTSGTGARTLTWTPTSGDWTAVLMSSNLSRPVTASADVGATVPGLAWLATGLIVGGLVLLVVGAVLIVVAVQLVTRARQVTATGSPTAPAAPASPTPVG